LTGIGRGEVGSGNLFSKAAVNVCGVRLRRERIVQSVNRGRGEVAGEVAQHVVVAETLDRGACQFAAAVGDLQQLARRSGPVELSHAGIGTGFGIVDDIAAAVREARSAAVAVNV